MSSSTIPEPPPSPSPAPAPNPAQLGQELAAARERLRQQGARVRKGIWIETLGVLGLLAVAYAIPTLLTDRLLRLEWIFRAVLLGSFAVVLLRVVGKRLLRPLAVQLNEEEIALAVERRSPELEQALISGLQFERELSEGSSRSIESPELKAAVVANVRERIQQIPFARAVDGRRVARFGWGIAAFLAFFVAWAAIAPAVLGTWAARNVALLNVDWPRYTTLAFAAGDGEVRLPQGDALTVRVQVDGPVPDQLFLDYEFASGDAGSEPMSRTGDNEFSWTLDAVLEDVELTVQGGDSLPVEMAVTIVERPRIDGLAVRVKLPAYMERDPFDVPATEGELRLPRGAEVQVSGSSQKPLTAAFLLAGNDRKVPLELNRDDNTFRGSFRPESSGLMVVDVIDADRLGAGTPPKLLLRVGDDKVPTLEFRLRGIGSSITAHARIPGLLKVRDDFGLSAVGAVMRAIEDDPADRGSEAKPLPEQPWADAKPIYTEQLARMALRYEAEASVDLTTWNKVPNQNSKQNPIRPGMLFSLRYSAKDNFGPGDPHEGFGETMTFRVVTRDKLHDELRRRQVEQRQELQRIADEESVATSELEENINPKDAGENARLATARFRALARRQQALGRRVRFVGESYQRILWEFENNRLIEANKVRQIEGLITGPLATLAKEAFPATSQLVDRFLRTGDEAVRREAIDGYREIERRLAAVLKEMEQAETLAALLEELRNVINLEKDAIRDVRQRVQDREQDLFNKKTNEDDDK